MIRSFLSLSFASSLVALSVIACGEDEPKAGNGVNDVRKACDLRIAWNRSAQNCSVCESAVVSPRCECEQLKDFSAACIEQADSRKAACAQAVDECVFKCDREDCSCIDQCYVNDAACKQASAARDGCIVEACTKYCQ